MTAEPPRPRGERKPISGCSSASMMRRVADLELGVADLALRARGGRMRSFAPKTLL